MKSEHIASTEVATTTQHVEMMGDEGFKASDPASDAMMRGQTTTGYEDLGILETIKTFKICTLVCFAMAFSAATDGYQIGINASIIANTGFVSRFATTVSTAGKPALASPILSGWSSIMSCGQIIGMTTLPFLSSRYGRKVAIKIMAKLGWRNSWQGLEWDVYSRLFWWTLGSFFAQVALQHLASDNPTNYLTPIYTQWAHIAIMLIIYILVPESPAWCVNAGKEDRAKKELLKLNRGVPNYDLQRQFQVLSLAVEHERAVAVEQRREKWYGIFQGVNGLRTVISFWTNLTQQLIGLSLFGTFGTYFFQQAGLADPFKIKVITTSIQIGTVIVVVITADRLGRRILACSGTTLCWVSCVAIGIIGVCPQVNASTYIFILFACLWNCGLATNGATGWGYIGEISSQRLRPYTAGFGAAVTCVAGVVMNVLIPYMTNSSKWDWGLKTGWFYAGVGFPFVIGMWLLIPETSGRSPAELDELFERKVKPWRFHKTQSATQRLALVDNLKEN
ncbi:hypothetical protein N7513_012567 [Penicillium frequentans]|nr:hypothetical protein N7513_012567 [Penicillium glabrum]